MGFGRCRSPRFHCIEWFCADDASAWSMFSALSLSPSPSASRSTVRALYFHSFNLLSRALRTGSTGFWAQTPYFFLLSYAYTYGRLVWRARQCNGCRWTKRMRITWSKSTRSGWLDAFFFRYDHQASQAHSLHSVGGNLFLLSSLLLLFFLLLNFAIFSSLCVPFWWGSISHPFYARFFPSVLLSLSHCLCLNALKWLTILWS